jgi:hypothetical protein
MQIITNTVSTVARKRLAALATFSGRKPVNAGRQLSILASDFWRRDSAVQIPQ